MCPEGIFAPAAVGCDQERPCFGAKERQRAATSWTRALLCLLHRFCKYRIDQIHPVIQIHPAACAIYRSSAFLVSVRDTPNHANQPLSQHSSLVSTEAVTLESVHYDLERSWHVIANGTSSAAQSDTEECWNLPVRKGGGADEYEQLCGGEEEGSGQRSVTDSTEAQRPRSCHKWTSAFTELEVCVCECEQARSENTGSTTHQHIQW